jgi:hypothetical protein
LTTPVYPAGQTPYCTIPELLAAPTGVSWSTIPSGANVSPAAKTAEQLNILGRATARADNYCNQVLRATLDTEQVDGPDYRVTVQNGTGNGRIILSRWPILQIVSVQVAPNAVFPRQWTSLQSGQWDIEVPTIGLLNSIAPAASIDGGQAIIIPPGWVNWGLGRHGWLVRVQYVNGWPHTSLTAAVTAGESTLPVDDCTGWGITGEWGNTGAAGIVYDGNNQETIQATTTSVTSGPGNVTTALPLVYDHAAGTMVTSLPQQVIDATILFSAAQALQRGATSTTVHSIPGGPGGGGSMGTISEYVAAGERLLAPLRRTI